MQKRKDQVRTANEDIHDIFANWYGNSKAKVEKIEHTKARAHTHTDFTLLYQGNFLYNF